MHAVSEVKAIEEEFIDRFGPLPEMVRNLLFHVEVRILAEKVGLASISSEANQIVLRFPQGHVPGGLPDLGKLARIGKTAIWMQYVNIPDWTDKLIELLNQLKSYGVNQPLNRNNDYLSASEIGNQPDYSARTASI